MGIDWEDILGMDEPENWGLSIDEVYGQNVEKCQDYESDLVQNKGYKRINKISGMYEGKIIEIKPVWGEHVFTKDELEALFNGESVCFEHTNKNGVTETITGRIVLNQEFKGSTFDGFKPDW